MPEYRVRRATLDDLGPLTALWKSMGFSSEDLAKRVTEFQVAESDDGRLLGAVGFQIADRQARIYGEGFTDFALADSLRALFWDRFQTLAANHGLWRLWTQEEAPFWNRNGFLKPDAEALAKLPASWHGTAWNWRTLKLKEDLEAVLSLDKEFALFMQSEKDRSARVLRHAKVVKILATVIAIGVLIGVMVAAFYLLRRNPQLIGR
jgi:N-acetylglutamate synthase-like GNAT family acetyltransferase